MKIENCKLELSCKALLTPEIANNVTMEISKPKRGEPRKGNPYYFLGSYKGMAAYKWEVKNACIYAYIPIHALENALGEDLPIKLHMERIA